MLHDSKLWCEDCQKANEGECEKHGPLTHISDTEVSTRARISLPHILELKEGKVHTGIFAKQKLSKRLQFGPLQALIEKDPQKWPTAETEIKNRFGIVYKLMQDKDSAYLLDTRFEDLSNWMIFVRPAEKKSEQNLVAFQYRKEIYFATSKDVQPHCELRVWYSRDYAQLLKMKLLSEESGAWHFRTRHKFSCIGCGVVFSSTANLRNHQCIKLRSKSGKSSEPLLISQPEVKKQVEEEQDVRKDIFEEGGVFLGGEEKALTAEPLISKLATSEVTESTEVRSRKIIPSKRTPFIPGKKTQEVKVEFSEWEAEESSKHEKGSYLCSICDKIFHSPAKLKQHFYSHTGERPFSCAHCHKAFSSRFKLGRHQLIHTGERQHQCPHCNRSFHRKDHLKNHIQIHDPNKQYKCKKPDCGKEYNSYMSYRKHCAVHSAEDGDLECKICLEVFLDKTELINHLRVHVGTRSVKNPGEKKFSCDQCDRRFFTRKDVKRHLVVHTGKRDFICSMCPQKFGRKDHLIRHLKKSHNIFDPLRLELFDPLNVAGPSSAPHVPLTSPSSIAIREETFSSLFPTESLVDPLKSFASSLQSTTEATYSSTAFPTEFRFFEEGVKEEPELTASVEHLSGGDDISRMLGMYLSASEVGSNLPPISTPNEPISQHVLTEEELSPLHMEPPPHLLPLSEASEFAAAAAEDPVSLPPLLVPMSRSSPPGDFSADSAATFISTPPSSSRPGLIIEQGGGGGFRSLLEEDSTSAISSSPLTSTTVTTLSSSSSSSTTFSTITTTSTTSSLPGFDQAFP